MADQSNGTGVSASLISAVERGAIGAPDGYVAKLVEWMQLDDLEALQLKNLAKLRSKKPKGKTAGHSDLKGILDHLPIEKKPLGIGDDKGTTS